MSTNHTNLLFRRTFGTPFNSNCSTLIFNVEYYRSSQSTAGLVGLLLNVLIFTQPILNRGPCSFYFLLSTVFNLFVVLIILPVRIVSNSFNLDLANYNSDLCKAEFYSFYIVRVASVWLILLACIDRYLHSSSNIKLRRLSSIKIARLSSCILIMVMIIIYSHIPVYFEIAKVVAQSGRIASIFNARKGTYRSFSASWHMTFYSLCPSFLMLLFGAITTKNIRHSRRTDTQLLRVLTKPRAKLHFKSLKKL
ncbi:unnamed protein product [Adineta ricciae]|uniref:G-protein coupled receptors family 1 profile domain-containing protein n=1 Tax=Adineta ricciae TaxID=249248 RepID=A0A814DB27_ADIRI|nr:unnamed protein product [Adineta ricciae]